MRLIDADDFKKFLQALCKAGAPYCEVVQLLDAQPTAYNPEKVVEELEAHKVQYGKLQLAHNNANMVRVYVGKEQAIDCAIDIVRKGGAE